MRCFSLLALALWCCLPAVAQSGPRDLVQAFYVDYRAASEANGRWVDALLQRQAAHMDPFLVDGLRRLEAGDPSSGEPFLDFDPFSNSQMGMESYTVGSPTQHQGLVYIPIFMRLSRDPGPESLRARFVLRDQGQGYKIVNIVYPAEDGAPAWDLKGYLRETLQPRNN